MHARPCRRHRCHDRAGPELWARLGRPNTMIKVPATAAGVPAIERLTADGVNVNVTLLFSVDRYRQVMDAYLTGLEARRRRGPAIDRIASAASFFVSRVDTKVDLLLPELSPLREKPRWLTPKLPSTCTRRRLRRTDGGTSLRPVRVRNGRSGPAPERRMTLLRRALRRISHRSGCRQHHAASNAGCVRRPRRDSGDAPPRAG